MTAENPPGRGIPTRNDRTAIEDLKGTLRDSPDRYCVRAAHPFGTVWIRRDEHDRWMHSVFIPADPQAHAQASDGFWYESRVYGYRLSTLLKESEASILPLDAYPGENIVADAGDGSGAAPESLDPRDPPVTGPERVGDIVGTAADTAQGRPAERDTDAPEHDPARRGHAHAQGQGQSQSQEADGGGDGGEEASDE